MVKRASSSTVTAKEAVALSGDRVRTVEAVLDGYTRKHLFIRVPREDYGGLIGLTLSRKLLPHGLATFPTLQVQIDYASLRHTDSGFVADVVIERSKNANKQDGEATELHSEGEQAEA